MTALLSCPCGSGHPFAACCGPRLDDSAPAPDAEALMRSRYTAYVLGNETYLLATWHPDTRPSELGLDRETAVKWLGLRIMRHENDGDGHAIVEFVARYKVGGRGHRLRETSRFVHERGRWLYLDGDCA